MLWMCVVEYVVAIVGIGDGEMVGNVDVIADRVAVIVVNDVNNGKISAKLVVVKSIVGE